MSIEIPKVEGWEDDGYSVPLIYLSGLGWQQAEPYALRELGMPDNTVIASDLGVAQWLWLLDRARAGKSLIPDKD